jgi:DNA-binding PadR family transcriptional regulator
MLELAILGLLKDRPMHGYQLSRELGDSIGGFWRVSYGSLYPTLRKLENQGAIEVMAPDQPGTARRRNVYAITQKGEMLFFELLQGSPSENPVEDSRFRVRLAFFRYLSPDSRIRLLERRKSYLQERKAEVERSMRSGGGSADGYKLALLEHGNAAIVSDIEWLDGLIQAERERTGFDPHRGRERRAATLRRKEHTR